MEAIYLPDSLFSHSYVQEFHGTLETMVRGIFNHYMGWFSSDPLDLHPLPKKDEALEIIKFAGGEEQLLKVAMDLFKDENFHWILQICDWLSSAGYDSEAFQVG